MQDKTSNVSGKATNDKRQTTNILDQMRNWCAYQERCQQEVRDKLYDLGQRKDEIEAIISTLISEKFIDEERFAVAFAGGKFRIKKWGRIKIRSMLKMKRISDYSIHKALEQLDEDVYKDTLQQLLETKKRTLKSETNKIRRNYKLLRFAQSRGYETELVMQLLGE